MPSGKRVDLEGVARLHRHGRVQGAAGARQGTVGRQQEGLMLGGEPGGPLGEQFGGDIDAKCLQCARHATYGAARPSYGGPPGWLRTYSIALTILDLLTVVLLAAAVAAAAWPWRLRCWSPTPGKRLGQLSPATRPRGRGDHDARCRRVRRSGDGPPRPSSIAATDPCGRAVNVRDGRDDRPKPSRMRFGS